LFKILDVPSNCSGGISAAVMMVLAQRLWRSRYGRYCGDGDVGAAIAAMAALAQ
jgi:hypothetical protein